MFTSCDPFHTKVEDQEPQVQSYKANSINITSLLPTSLKVATWNIKFGAGRIDVFFDCYGDRVLITEQEVLDNMAALCLKIKQMNPDIIFLQEVDVDSKRSGYVDQVQYILDHSDLNYGVYAAQWLADYVPNHGIGQMNSGNAILSKYPLNSAQRIALPLITEQSALEKYFYLRRNILTANIMISSQTIELLATHTSAYSNDGTKTTQIQIIKDRIAGLNANGQSFIIGGDFNNIPPGTIKYCNFDDDVCADDSPFKLASCEVLAKDLDVMKIFSEYNAAIPQDVYMQNQDLYASFTSNKDGFWNRKLDYIFTNDSLIDGSGMVHQGVSTGGMETMPLSDHAPISTIYLLK
tara:strand:- start:139855 stop:140907 length:1053 start_codon:yes stop_codon:yes gene_type:complete